MQPKKQLNARKKTFFSVDPFPKPDQVRVSGSNLALSPSPKSNVHCDPS